MIDNEALRIELLKDEYWDEAYARLATKPYVTKDDLGDLFVLRNLQREQYIDTLISGAYEWSIPRKLMLAKHGSKKKRIVYVYSIQDRYILGVLYRALSYMCKDLVSDRCFSYKKNVSTSTAVKYVLNNKGEAKHGVKLDIHSYFNSVSREKVTAMIDELFTGGFKTTMQKLLLIDLVMYKGSIIDEYKALIPGCALGSFFANYTLRECDEYFDERGVLYARYSDDIIILANNNEELYEHIEVVKKYLAEYGLVINESKYKWFTPSDEVEFLVLKITQDDKIDISDNGKRKIKKQIHRWCRKGRIEIEKGHISFESQARKILSRFNYKNFKCYIDHDNTFGWCHYAFRYITTIDTLRELDFYVKDTLRAMKTGKHNKANARVLNDEELKELGWVSLVELYNLYKFDFDYYCEIIELFY